MFITINKIKSFGMFKDFKWHKNIPNLCQFNLIYGWNYSGKTTLSRVFRCLELGEVHRDFQDTEFEIIDDNENVISHDKLHNTPYQVRVFNTDFVEENLDWDNQVANPIFILGKEDITLQKSIDLLRKESNELCSENKQKVDKYETQQSVIENQLTDKAREIDRIRPPYDKRKLKSVLGQIKEDPEKDFLTDDRVHQLLEILRTSQKENLSSVKITTLPAEILTKIENVLERNVLSKTIERLKNNPELNNWVRKGIEIHKEKTWCEFCKGLLDKEILKEYEQHFSQEYENLLIELHLLADNLERYKLSVTLPDRGKLYTRIEEEYVGIKENLENSIEKYNEVIFPR